VIIFLIHLFLPNFQGHSWSHYSPCWFRRSSWNKSFFPPRYRRDRAKSIARREIEAADSYLTWSTELVVLSLSPAVTEVFAPPHWFFDESASIASAARFHGACWRGWCFRLFI